MVIFLSSQDQKILNTANFHQKLVLLSVKDLFKISYWAKFWYIKCQYKLKHLIWQIQRRIYSLHIIIRLFIYNRILAKP